MNRSRSSPLAKSPRLDDVDVIDESESGLLSLGDLVLPEPLSPISAAIEAKLNSYGTRSKSGSLTPSSSTEDILQQDDSSSSSTAFNSSIGGRKSIIPGFVTKLYRMVNESTSNLIKWGSDGTTFMVTSPEDFSRQVLPLFFKHNNFSSFVRQLNMYGFHKIPHLQQGSMVASALGSSEASIWEFSHANFVRGRPDLLNLVRRKIGKDEDGSGGGGGNASSNTGATGAMSGNSNKANLVNLSSDMTFNSLRNELQMIRQQQSALRSDLQSIQRDNQLLWSENMASRERHLHQQQVIDKILRFLASVFTSDGKIIGSAPGSSQLTKPVSGAGNVGSNNNNPTSSLLDVLHHPTPNSSSGKRPLLIEDVSSASFGSAFDGNQEDFRRQVMELIETNGSSPLDPTQKIINLNRLVDLESTSRDISQDISVIEDDIDVLADAKLDEKAHGEADSEISDFDFSNYLNCQSLE